MNIAIDAHTFSPAQMVGGDVYVAHLVEQFAQIGGEDSFLVLLNAFSPAARRSAVEAIDRLAGGRVHTHVSRLPSRLPERLFNAWYYCITAPRAATAHDVDVFFGTNFYCFTKGDCRKVVKIHDVAPLVCPEFTHPRMFSRFRRDMLRVTAAADAVLTDTLATKADIVQTLQVPPDKVVAVYEAPGECFAPSDRDEAKARLASRYDLRDPFFLFVGTVQPRKNVPNIIRAFDRAKAGAALPHHLVLVGKFGWGFQETLAAHEDSPHRDQVHFLHYVPAEHLQDFYNAADALVWPSHYEGIGLPLLEAMACGTPVITSDRGSMKETAAGAARLVDPLDLDSIAQALRDLAGDEALRADLRERGLERAAKFSWHKTAQETLAVLKGEGGET